MLAPNSNFRLLFYSVAEPKILKGGRQFISPVLIYRKCTQRSIDLLHGKRRLFGKHLANRGAAPTAPAPLIPPLFLLLQTIHKFLNDEDGDTCSPVAHHHIALAVGYREEADISHYDLRPLLANCSNDTALVRNNVDAFF